MIRITMIAAALAASCVGARAGTECPPPGLSHDMSFAEAREAVLAAGWDPVPQDDDGYRFPYDDHWARAYPETAACSGTGLAHCAFLYGSDGDRMRLVSAGEGLPIQEPMLFGWVCGDRPIAGVYDVEREPDWLSGSMSNEDLVAAAQMPEHFPRRALQTYSEFGRRMTDLGWWEERQDCLGPDGRLPCISVWQREVCGVRGDTTCRHIGVRVLIHPGDYVDDEPVIAIVAGEAEGWVR